jgi:hypothetical protein
VRPPPLDDGTQPYTVVHVHPGGQGWTGTAAGGRAGSWPRACAVHRLELQAGDCVLFTEKLTHATHPWTGRGSRRSMFFK